MSKFVNINFGSIGKTVKTTFEFLGTKLNKDGSYMFIKKGKTRTVENITIPKDSILTIKDILNNGIDVIVSWDNELYIVNKSSLETRSKFFTYSDKLTDFNKTGIFN